MLLKDALAQVTGATRSPARCARTAPTSCSAEHVPGTYDGLVVGGVSEHLFKRRVYNPDDDPKVAGGFSTKSGPAVTVMREVVAEQLISPAMHPERAFPGIRLADIGEDTSPNYPFRREIGQQNVLDVLSDIAKATRLDFWFEFDGIDPGGYPRSSFTPAGVARTLEAQPSGGPYVYLTPRRQPGRAKLPTARRKQRGLRAGQGRQREPAGLPAGRTSAVVESPFNRIEGGRGSEADA